MSGFPKYSNVAVFQESTGSASRFDNMPFIDEQTFFGKLLERISVNTSKSTEMAIKAYRSWREWSISKPETSANYNLPIVEIGPQMTHQVDFPRWDHWLAR